ncbi:MAG: hypothetical protein HXK70_05075 [Clostridiales bacterium]|nr:hypothetical protein [Clostridiales bacterium]
MREEKFKYQYTYHILPYIYEGRYDEYLTRLLKDTNIIEYRYDKIKNLEIFSYFKKDILESMFYEFPYKETEKISIQKKVNKLLKYESVTFEYDIIDKEKNKISMNDIVRVAGNEEYYNNEKNRGNIKFDIEDLKIIVFKSGIAFIILKTVLINTRYISDVMDFNYRFKSILSKRDIIKKLDNIEICLFGDEVNGFEKLKQIILNYVGKNKNNKLLENNEEFYTFSYLCMDNIYINEESNKNILKNIYLKYSRILQSSYDTEGLDEETIVSKNMTEIKDTNIGITKISSMLLCSGIDPFNFTVLPRDYETKMLYTYIITLYQKLFLVMINKELTSENNKKQKLGRIKFNDFISKMWYNEITLSEKGSIYYEYLKKILEINKTFDETQLKYKLIFRYNKTNKSNIFYKIMGMIGIISIGLNIYQYFFRK